MNNNKKYKIIRNKNKQKGGTGTAGNLGTLIDDIVSLATKTISTVTNVGDLILYTMNLNSNLNQPYSPSETNAPGANLSS